MVYVTYSPAKKPKNIRHSKASTSFFLSANSFLCNEDMQKEEQKAERFVANT